MGGIGRGRAREQRRKEKEKEKERREVRGSVQPIPPTEKQLIAKGLDVSQHKKCKGA